MWFWQALIVNLAIAAIFIGGWQYVGNWLDHRSMPVRKVSFGAILGALASVAMIFAVELGNGIFFDLRLSFLAVSGLFGGPLAAGTSVMLAVLTRVALGGPAPLGADGLMLVAGLLGVAGNYMARKTLRTVPPIIAVSIASALLVWVSFSLIPADKHHADIGIILPQAVGTILMTTLALSFVVRNRLQSSDERRLLLAALLQSPDYQFVKDRLGRFVLANSNVAQFFGSTSASDILGKTNTEASAYHDQAMRLHENEQYLMRTGTSMEGMEETLVGSNGETKLFSSSKIPVFSSDGRVIGLAATARDVTEQRKFEAEIEHNRSILDYALSEMSDGLAMFDENGLLILCNEQFRSCFPRTAHAIAAGVHYRDIFRSLAASGEELNVPAEPSDDWIEEFVTSLQQDRAREIPLGNGHWLRMKARWTAENKAIVTVSDLTEMKMANQALLTLTDQLKALAATDGLTGLMNRREFDASFEAELRRSERSKHPVSLLLIDIDHFKSFNDLYGHLAGDDCLRAISSCLKQTPRRPGDLAARFGGEEFVIILSDTDAPSAMKVAEDLRRRLVDLSLIHEGNEEGIVTASIGVATYAAEAERRKAEVLLQRADEALYQAKDSGRNRAIAWSGSRESERATG